MAPRDLLLEVPYRSLDIAEDVDLRQRLAHRDALLWLHHEPFVEEIGYRYDLQDRLKKMFHVKIAQLRMGTRFWSSVRWTVSQRSWSSPVLYYELVSYPIAFLLAVLRGYYDPTPGFERRVDYWEKVVSKRMTISEIEHEFDISIDRSVLSERGRELFCSPTDSR
ncbi:hypothetical protein [Haloarcula sp. JP-L23]|uniref:hypothetical protein n=1 Tax=Haloarcula sp. JP-L23 TaxID=2716717 RepID=UPI00140F1120|nr:hypothetical protein G9465_17960 [Haloarcula sp. JP-L23]